MGPTIAWVRRCRLLPIAVTMLLLALGTSTAFAVARPHAAAVVPHTLAVHGRRAAAHATGDGAALPGLVLVSAGAALGLHLAARARTLLGARGQRSALMAVVENYWEGEWICADCGYIYSERAYGDKFEDLKAGFQCPLCAAPRRRFARKLGDKIGTTLDGGDTPIIIFTAVSLVVLFGFVYWGLS